MLSYSYIIITEAPIQMFCNFVLIRRFINFIIESQSVYISDNCSESTSPIFFMMCLKSKYFEFDEVPYIYLFIYFTYCAFDMTFKNTLRN